MHAISLCPLLYLSEFGFKMYISNAFSSFFEMAIKGTGWSFHCVVALSTNYL